MDESLWPARNVAEYSYCPRLFYFMEVEGIHVASDDTLKGVRIHRKADSPSASPSSEDKEESDRPQVQRSLTLTSAALELTATLDLADIEGDLAVPIEYRKGRPRQNCTNSDENQAECQFEPWPTDRIQVGLQAILLEEAGYRVPRCVLYYDSIRQRLEIPFDETLKQESLSILSSAKECAKGPRPLPLLNDPKCPRCSLQPICLPDEINSQRSDSSSPPRQLLPRRDDGIHLVAQSHGTHIGVRGASLQIANGDEKTPQSLPLANIESLSLLGSVQISTQALHTLAEKGIPVSFLSAAGRLITILDPLDSVSAETRKNQVRRTDDPLSCLTLSRQLIAAKIRNQRTLLMRNAGGLPQRIFDSLADQAREAEQAESLESLRGHEGQAAAIYFGQFSKMLKTDVAGEFQEHGRQRRPPPDPVNCCLSLAYSMLTHECTAALRAARLEPSIGAFHVSRPGRPSLSLDLMEPFRPLISDSLTISAFNRGELREGHVQRTAAGCLFTDHGRKAFFGTYGRRMSEEITHPTLGYKLSYRRMLILHARMIAAWMNGEIPDLSFLTTR